MTGHVTGDVRKRIQEAEAEISGDLANVIAESGADVEHLQDTWEFQCAMHVALRSAIAGPCCQPVADRDFLGCTCWDKIYDKEQQPADPSILSSSMSKACIDCAYKPDSPERNGAAHVKGDPAFLASIVENGEPFWCHDGMRQTIAYVHRLSHHWVQVPADVDYDQPIHDGTPYRADGRPGDLCAGWTARRLAHLQRGVGQ